MMNYTLTIKKHSITFILYHACRASLDLGYVSESPFQRLGFCSNTSAINPGFIASDEILSKVFISIFMIDKLFTDIHMTLFLIFTQQVWHKFDYDVRQNFSVRIS
jgi:hypothetical protein